MNLTIVALVALGASEVAAADLDRPGSFSGALVTSPEVEAHLERSDVLSPATAFRASRATQTTQWNGGTYVTQNGQRLSIFVHHRYRFDPAQVQQSAEWLSQYLFFADELPRATFFRIPPELIATFCGDGAYGCYDPQSAHLYVPWNTFPDGMHWMSVTAHEYGHHVAWSRANPPWLAGLYGPKRWASAARVCPRVQAGQATPDGRGGLYWSDPGEIFAETYAKAVNREGSWLENWWPTWGWSYDPTFAPDSTTVAAARVDATAPYAAPTVDAWSGRLTRKKVRVRHKGRWRLEPRGPVLPRTLQVRTPFDGAFHAVLDVSPGASLAVTDAGSGALLAPAGHAVSLTVCGQRTLKLRVASHRPGQFRVSMTYP